MDNPLSPNLIPISHQFNVPAGFGVTIRDLPSYMKWGSEISYLRYGLEGYVSAIYGDRDVLACEHAIYCHYRYFLRLIGMGRFKYYGTNFSGKFVYEK